MTLQIETDSELNPYTKHEQEIEALRQQLEDQQKLNGDPMYFIKACESYRQQLAEKDAENRLLHERHREDNKILAASQAREQQLREALEDWQRAELEEEAVDILLSRPTDTSALQDLIAKAGEVMRERCISAAPWPYDAATIRGDIRALPAVTLSDLK